MGIRGGSVLAPWRPFFSFAAEVVIYAVGALAAPPHYLPLVEPLRPGPIFLGGAPAPPATLPPPLLSIPLPLPLTTRSLPYPALLLPRFVARRPTAVAAAGTAGFAAALSAVTALPTRLCAVGSACAAPTTAPIAVNAVVMTAALLLLRMRWCEIIVFCAQPTASRR